MATVVERVDTLEEVVKHFVRDVGIEFNKLYNVQVRTELELQALKEDTQAFKDEMRAFKDEMRLYREDTQAFKDEMRAFKDEMRLYREDTQAFKDEMRLYREDTQAFKDEMRLYREDTQAFKDEMRLYREDTQAFKDEMRVFKDEMRVFKDEGRAENREMNLRWGQLANRLGTLVEDLVAPSLPRVVKEVLGLEVDDLFVRYRRRRSAGTFEFDAIVLAGDLVVLNYTKATLDSRDVERFIQDIGRFREVFPEYAARPLVGVLATLNVEPSVLAYAEKTGFLVLGVGDQLMEVKNGPGFVPKRW